MVVVLEVGPVALVLVLVLVLELGPVLLQKKALALVLVPRARVEAQAPLSAPALTAPEAGPASGLSPGCPLSSS